MYKIVFYEDKNGYAELEVALLEYARKAPSNKNIRIQFKQIVYCVELLKEHGNCLPTTIAKHIEGDIWELRPGSNRILYFFFKNDNFVLLHMFRKTTQKTPKNEIDRAKKECDDYIKRNGGEL